MNKQLIKGVLLVAIGASSYGMVATFIKKGIQDNYTIAEMVFAQALLGTIIIVILNILTYKSAKKEQKDPPTSREKLLLMLGGIPFALTSTFYYLSLQYADVSVCIVMLMQSVWIGVVIDYFVNKIKPSPTKIFAILVVLGGTVLATNLLFDHATLDWRGLLFGFLAALSYSFTFLVTNNVATKQRPLLRSMYMLLGLLIVVSIIWGPSLASKFDFSILYKWGLIIAFFGTVLPPLFFTKGMPLIGVGLGGIVASMELPVSVTMAYFLIDEQVSLSQWLGILLILFAVVMMNISPKKKNTKLSNHVSE